jgi:hypothetical protein
MCSIEPEVDEDFSRNRWEQNAHFDEDITNEVYPVKKFFHKDMNEPMIMEILNKEKLMDLIKKSEKQSAPGLDGITFPFLKLEQEATAHLIVSMLRVIISVGKIGSI